MLFLAGTAFCSTDSYDPNPYDDIPPIVTVEFDYVVPAQTAHALVRTGFANAGLHALGYVETCRVPMLVSVEFNPDQDLPAVRTESPATSLPLRR
jgi:hypothetical protein